MRNDCAFGHRNPFGEIPRRLPARLFAHAAQGEERVAVQLLGIERNCFISLGNGQGIEVRLLPEIRRAENHVNRRALADGELPRTPHVILQLLHARRQRVAGPKPPYRRHRNSREQPDDRDDHEQLDQRKGRMTGGSFHGIIASRGRCHD